MTERAERKRLASPNGYHPLPRRRLYHRTTFVRDVPRRQWIKTVPRHSSTLSSAFKCCKENRELTLRKAHDSDGDRYSSGEVNADLKKKNVRQRPRRRREEKCECRMEAGNVVITKRQTQFGYPARPYLATFSFSYLPRA